MEDLFPHPHFRDLETFLSAGNPIHEVPTDVLMDLSAEGYDLDQIERSYAQ